MQRQQLAAAAAVARRAGGRPRVLRTQAAMFDGLSRSLEKAWDIVRKDSKLTADNIKEPMREIRWAAAAFRCCPSRRRPQC